MGARLGVSRPTVYRLLKDAGIDYSKRFHEITNTELDRTVADIKVSHPNAEEINIMGHLRARNIRLQRNRVREAIHRVDPEGPSTRSSRNFHSRVYESPCPNYIWHIDGNHKLVKWGFVTHLAIDGFSRLITLGGTSDNNKAETVFNKFSLAVKKYGRLLRVRTDHGGENVLVWRDMVNNNATAAWLLGHLCGTNELSALMEMSMCK